EAKSLDSCQPLLKFFSLLPKNKYKKFQLMSFPMVAERTLRHCELSRAYTLRERERERER
ncbi:hypothetical protein DRJ04_08545, partial [Candidatus Aerophobetes bacterium]